MRGKVYYAKERPLNLHKKTNLHKKHYINGSFKTKNRIFSLGSFAITFKIKMWAYSKQSFVFYVHVM